MKQFILWVDYGCEGWQPYDFDTKKEMAEGLLSGNHSTTIVTKNLQVKFIESLQSKESEE